MPPPDRSQPGRKPAKDGSLPESGKGQSPSTSDETRATSRRSPPPPLDVSDFSDFDDDLLNVGSDGGERTQLVNLADFPEPAPSPVAAKPPAPPAAPPPAPAPAKKPAPPVISAAPAKPAVHPKPVPDSNLTPILERADVTDTSRPQPTKTAVINPKAKTIEVDDDDEDFITAGEQTSIFQMPRRAMAARGEQRRKLPIGEMLIKDGHLKEEQLDMALKEQRRTQSLIGEVLVSLGFVSELIVAQTVGRQTNIPFVRVPVEPITPQLLKIVDEDMCRSHRVVPLGVEGTVLSLAMANPFDVVAIDKLRAVTGLIPFPSIAPWGEILSSIERNFAQGESFDASFEDLIVRAEARVGNEEKEAVTRGPLVELVDQLILRAVEERSTDIHIEPEENVVRIRYRIDSILQPGPMIPKKLQAGIAARIKVMAGLNISENRVPQDGRIRFTIKGRQIDLRVSTFLCNYGENIVLRVLDKSSVVLSFDKLGLLPDDRAKLDRLIDKPHGIVLVTGPTGSGKTTTLYAALSQLNTVDVNIMTIEDPIEYELNLIRQSQVNVKAGITFATGLRALLRQDPDIILIGEMRDEETAQMAVRAAMTGHLVFSTLHTNTAVGAIPRLVDMGIEPLMVTDTVVAIVAQRLGRTACDKCSELKPCPPERYDELVEAAAREKIEFDGMVVMPKGCVECKQRGYRGRAALYEIFEIDRKAQELILQKKYGVELSNHARSAGMRSMYDDGLRRVLLKRMTIEELDRVIDQELREEMN